MAEILEKSKKEVNSNVEETNKKKCKINIKNIITLENIMCLFIILCPILDMVSFIFRNQFQVAHSPSTIIRPLIPVCLMIYFFFKYSFKRECILGGCIYGIYAVLHLYVFKFCLTGSSYSSYSHELQYLINYSFMIMNLALYVIIFNKINLKVKNDKIDNCSDEKNKNFIKLKNGLLIANTIYIVSIFISIITKTSSFTYVEEQMGNKGWFESGNSLSAILTLSMFVLLPMLKNKKLRYWIISVLALVGIFLTKLIGTRVGLFGYILVFGIYVLTEIIVGIKNKAKFNKKIIAGGSVALVILLIAVFVCGSTTLKRRQHLREAESQIVEDGSKIAHLTGDLVDIKNSIDNNTIKDGYMNEPNKKSIIELYNIAEKKNLKNTDSRMQQLIYNACLFKNYKSFGIVMFGTGMQSQFRELVMEMEIPSMLFNFGIFGCILYFIPFAIIAIYGVILGIKKFKIIDAEYIMYVAGAWYTFALSTLSGYTFFNSSNMMFIIIIYTLLINKMLEIKNKKENQ